MAFYYKIACLDSGEEMQRSSLYRQFYVLSEALTIRLTSTFIWCSHCNKVTYGEGIEPLATLDAYIADLNDTTSERYQFLWKLHFSRRSKNKMRFVEEIKADAMLRRDWLIKRVSPPKCLDCGSENIIRLEVGNTIDTPVGQIYVEEIGRSSTDEMPRYYSIEGNRIDYKPLKPQEPIPTPRKWWQLWR